MLVGFSFISGRTNTYKLLTWFNVSVAFWGFGCFVAAISVNEKMALWGWKIAHIGGFFVAPIFYHLVSTLCGIRRQKIQFFGYLQGGIFNILNMGSNLVMRETRFAFNIFLNEATLLYAVAVFFYLALVVLSYLELTRFLKIADNRGKSQAKYVIFGFLFGFAGGTATLLPEFGIDFIYPAGNLGVFIYVTIVAYAVLRHNILDVEEMVEAAQRDKLAAIGMLSASINHEIRNPLFVIKGFNESLLANLRSKAYNKLTEEERRRKVEEILGKTIEQVDRASEISQRLTDFSKVARASFKEQIDLDHVVIDVLSFIKYGLEMDRIKIEKNIDPNMNIIANHKQMEQIFLNLIMNACQAMPKGGALKIVGHQDNGCTRIEVSDNGEGISPDKVSRIFEPFYTTKDKGTGLGLYITKQLVEKNGGRISVESSPQGGTTFTLEFGKKK